MSPRTHQLLRQLAAEEQESIQSVLNRALERYRREKFLCAANADFLALWQDAKAWEQEIRERELWDRSLADGISPE